MNRRLDFNAPIRHAAGRYWRHRYSILFFTLLIAVVATPLGAAIGTGNLLLRFLLAVCFMTAAAGLSERRAWRRALLLLSAVTVAGWLTPAAYTAPSVIAGTGAISGVLVVLAAVGAVRFAFRGDRIDGEHISAALSAYLIAGLLFGTAYYAVEFAWPGSLLAGGMPYTESSFSLDHAMYFSFVTLATLGYGDIVPGSELARGLAIVEAVGGQIYLVVMVARLVSLQVSLAKTPSTGGDHSPP